MGTRQTDALHMTAFQLKVGEKRMPHTDQLHLRGTPGHAHRNRRGCSKKEGSLISEGRKLFNFQWFVVPNSNIEIIHL